MRFYFDIEDYEFGDECGINFEQAILDSVAQTLANKIFYHETDTDRWYSEARKQVELILKSRQDEICERVVERVAEKVAKKKAIVAITPKVSEIAAADKSNVEYFEQMIDRAIAKRFGK